jgi:hypothetical protein
VTADGAAQLVGLVRHDVLLDQLYVRFYFYLPSSSARSGFATMITTQDQRLYQLMLYPEEAQGFAIEGEPPAPALGFAAAVPRDRWTCLELLARFDATSGSVTLWLDGQPIATHTALALPLDPPLQELYLGLSTPAAAQGVTQIYYDDFALSSSRIGC